jgi:hypothetical protein
LVLYVFALSLQTGEENKNKNLWVRSREEAKVSSFIYHAQTGSEAQPAPYTMGTGGAFPQGKAARGVMLTIRFHIHSMVLNMKQDEFNFYLRNSQNFLAWGHQTGLFLLTRVSQD